MAYVGQALSPANRSVFDIRPHCSCGNPSKIAEPSGSILAFMFRHVEGYKARYGDMILMVAHDFVEWHVIVIKTPTVVIQGGRQFSEAKALEHARQLADSYIRDE